MGDRKKVRLGHDVVPIEFTVAVGAEYTIRAKEVAEAMTKKKDDDFVKMPEAFTGKASKWPAFYKLFGNYLSSKKNRNCTPINYVVRKADDPADPEQYFANPYEKLILTTPHEGTDYADDNGLVWETLQALTLKGSAYAYIGQFERMQDGHGAIKVLIGRYEGPASMSRTKQAVYYDIHNAVYTGEKRNFTFEHYIDKHTKAYQILAEHGVVVDEEKKVDDFLRGIQDLSIHMTCAKTLVYGNNLWQCDFQACTEYLSAFTANTPHSTSHSISSVGGRGHGHQGRGRRRGGCGGCGGRGQGRGSGPSYTNEEWAAFTNVQRDNIKRRRAQQKREEQHDVGSMESEQKESPPGANHQNAGDQFGASNKKPKSN